MERDPLVPSQYDDPEDDRPSRCFRDNHQGPSYLVAFGSVMDVRILATIIRSLNQSCR